MEQNKAREKEMKLYASIMALSLGMASAALAQSQLERSLGVEPGRYTAHELAIMKVAAEQDGGESRVHFGQSNGAVVSSLGGGNARAAAILSDIAEADDNASFRPDGARAGGVTFSAPATWSENYRHNGGNS
jgi:hypothetical protein